MRIHLHVLMLRCDDDCCLLWYLRHQGRHLGRGHRVEEQVMEEGERDERTESICNELLLGEQELAVLEVVVL